MNRNNGDNQESSELRLASPLKKILRCFSPRKQEDHAGNIDLLVSGLLSPKLEKELMIDRKVFSPVKSMSNALFQSFTIGQSFRKSPPRKEEDCDEHDDNDNKEEDNGEESPTMTEEEIILLLCREFELIGDGEK
jgi:hypothetical protein